MQKLPLKTLNKDRVDHIIQKYDENSHTKFDYNNRKKPSTAAYRRFDEFVRNNKGLFYPPNILASVPLAELNLKFRGLIGIVLGSTAKYLFSPPDNIESLNSHNDFDVLILQPHSWQNPAPNEWGIDWWIRPRCTSPTNGRTDLWYDISLKDDVEVQKETKLDPQTSPFILNTEDAAIGYEPDYAQKFEFAEQTRNGVRKVLLSPGLYLPDAELFKKIIAHSNKKAKELKYEQKHKMIRLFMDKVIQLYKDCFEGLNICEYSRRCASLEDDLSNILSHNGININRLTIDKFGSLLHFGCCSGNFKPFKKFIGSLIGELESKSKRYDWNFLDLKNTDSSKALFPVLPNRLLTFQPL